MEKKKSEITEAQRSELIREIIGMLDALGYILPDDPEDGKDGEAK